MLVNINLGQTKVHVSVAKLVTTTPEPLRLFAALVHPVRTLWTEPLAVLAAPLVGIKPVLAPLSVRPVFLVNILVRQHKKFAFHVSQDFSVMFRILVLALPVLLDDIK